MSGIYSQGPNPTERDTTLRDLLSVIFRRKWLILSIFGLTSLIIGFKTLTTPQTYTADATLLLNRQGARSSVLERTSRQLPWVEVVESEIEVLKSMPVLQMALSRLRDASESEPVDITLGELNKSISAGVVGESNVLYVSGTSEDPRLAPKITNAVCESYVEYHDKLFELPNPVGMIVTRSDSVFSLIEDLSDERAQILRGLNTGDAGEQQKLLATHREQLRHLLSETERDIARLRTQIVDTQEFFDDKKGTLPFTEGTGSVQGSSMVDMVRRLSRQREDLRQLKEKYTRNHPLVIEAATAVESLEKSLNEQVREMIAVRQHELRVAQSLRQETQRQMEDINAKIAEILEKSSRLESMDSQLRTLRIQYEELAEQLVGSEITGESYREYGVKILSPAIGAVANARADVVRLALGPILALMAAIGLAFYLETLDHSISNRDEIEQHLEIPVLASFPDSEDARKRPAESDDPVPYRRKGTSASS